MANPRLPLSGLSRRLRLRLNPTRQSSTATARKPQLPHYDPYALLSKPTWSIRTLLPPAPSPSPSATSSTTPSATPSPPPPPSPNHHKITHKNLTHLLRLSSLPTPTTPSQTTHILNTLHSQLHFLQNLQTVPTTDIPPLASIRDETPQGLLEATITPETLKAALAREEVVGRCKRPRRMRNKGEDIKGVKGAAAGEEWDVLGQAGERVGRYFVVRSGGNGKVQDGGGAAAAAVAGGKEGE